MTKEEWICLLQKAEKNLAKLQQDCQGKPSLLAIYEPSAKELTRRIKAELED